MKKVYNLLIDGEVVEFDKISLDDSGKPLNERGLEREFVYENNPTIVNISEMPTIPPVGSQYDPSAPESPFSGECYGVSGAFIDFGRFALVVGGVVKMIWTFDLTTEQGSRLNAVFLSNPTFLPPEIAE